MATFKTRSGFNLYVKLNTNLINIGIAAITAPPLPKAISVFTTESVAFAAGAQTAVVTVTPAVLPADESIIIRATPALSAGKSFVKSEFRQIEVLNAVVAGSINIAAAYIAKFGPIGAAGSKIFIEIIHVNEISGPDVSGSTGKCNNSCLNHGSNRSTVVS